MPLPHRLSLRLGLPLALALFASLPAAATPVTWIWTLTTGPVSDPSGAGLIAEGEALEIEVRVDPAAPIVVGSADATFYPASAFEIRLPGATLVGPQGGSGLFQSLSVLVADETAQTLFGQPGDALGVVSLGSTAFAFEGGGGGTLGTESGAVALDPSGQGLDDTGLPAPPPTLGSWQDAPGNFLAFT